jgi:hypothetical protein
MTNRLTLGEPLCLTLGGAAIHSPASIKKAATRNLRASQQEGVLGKNPASVALCGVACRSMQRKV